MTRWPWSRKDFRQVTSRPDILPWKKVRKVAIASPGLLAPCHAIDCVGTGISARLRHDENMDRRRRPDDGKLAAFGPGHAQERLVMLIGPEGSGRGVERQA